MGHEKKQKGNRAGSGGSVVGGEGGATTKTTADSHETKRKKIMSETKIIQDEWGDLHQTQTERGGWRSVKRVVFDEDEDGNIIEHEFSLISPKTKDYISALKGAGFSLQLNEMTWRAENNGLPIDDITESLIMNALRDFGLKGENHIGNAMLEMAYDNKYHPVKKYFVELPKWDGVDRLTMMLECLKSDNDELSALFMRKWMIGAVAKVFEQGQNFMLVLSGPQGIGKSYFTRWLAPLLFVEGALNPTNKDSLAQMIKFFIWEVAELEGIFKRSDVAALKDIITAPEITYRAPYAKYDFTRPSAASLIGTINPDGAGFMRDSTGNRRFAVIELLSITHSYTEIDKTQLWAQIYAYYLAGEKWELSKAERSAQDEKNTDYEIISPVEELFNKHYTTDPENKEFTGTIDIITHLETLPDGGLTGNQRANLMELSGILKKKGLTRVRKGGARVYGFLGVIKN